MNLTQIATRMEKLIVDNSPTILTGVGVVGTVATAYLTAKSTFKAAKTISDREFVLKTHPAPGPTPATTLQTKEKLALVWACYLPPVAAGSVTVAAIVCANRISVKRAAALAAAYSLTEGRAAEYKKKVEEKLGIKKEEALRTEIAQDHVNSNPPPSTLVIASGRSLFRDEVTGRYFESTMEQVRTAENEINRRILKDEYAVLTQFYELIGLPATSISEEYGWYVTDRDPFEVQYSTVLTPDGRPCIIIDYMIHPIRNGYEPPISLANKVSQKIQA